MQKDMDIDTSPFVELLHFGIVRINYKVLTS